MWTDPRDETAATAVARTDAAVGDSLDAQVIASLLELGDAEFFAELVDDFVSSTRTYLDSLEVALDAEDDDAVFKTAHTMKSAAANMGATRFAEMCRTIETAGRARELGTLSGVMASLAAEFEHVRTDLVAAQSGPG